MNYEWYSKLDPYTLLEVVARKRKGTWGGARPGAGRKPVLKDPVRITLDLEQDQLDALEAMATEAEVSVSAMVRRIVADRTRRRRS
jgi:hypothetical protein